MDWNAINWIIYGIKATVDAWELTFPEFFGWDVDAEVRINRASLVNDSERRALKGML